MQLSFINSNKEREFNELYKKYFAPFCVFANKFIDDISVCEDLVSDVFVNVWFKLEQEELIKETMLGYIKFSVRNSCLNFIKHREHERAYMDKCMKDNIELSESPENIYTLNELCEQLDSILLKLPENYRTVFLKSFYDGLTYAEIAKELNLSVKSINRYKQNTMALLREELEDFIPALILLSVFENVMRHIK